MNFYSHASCEARLGEMFVPVTRNEISTHTPLARRDESGRPTTRGTEYFYSHASCEARRGDVNDPIEIINFYSHASCEARLITSSPVSHLFSFLLTRLLRGATMLRKMLQVVLDISTHTPLARRDMYTLPLYRERTDFYSHASCEARLC